MGCCTENAGVSCTSEVGASSRRCEKMRDVLNLVQKRFLNGISKGFEELTNAYVNILEDGKVDYEHAVQGHEDRILHIFSIAMSDLNEDLKVFAKQFGEFALDRAYFGLIARYVRVVAERIRGLEPNKELLMEFLSESEKKMKEECEIAFEVQKSRFLASVESCEV